ncbi:MarP family serine protease [Kibdelosporangium phytohabitans]|uniref:Serine protease n=1 Tax=Kibdelosporangium phytohabitans TaxID=860235 RepID=A0A0N9HIM6_9PSEU|nr:MarP family serine protease [Kibdelosporangium phytohabitans]ALG05811.1 serine protease [Kibdelosporangium phytohabitans]MBE1466172.1 putative membrane protein required for colicin V production [Kibdelosporangium phytohabitans]
MNWVDVLVLALVVLAAISGARQGVVIALPALLGVFAGLVLGAIVAPLVVENFTNFATRAAFFIAIVVFLVALGETAGVWVGRTLRRKMKTPNLTPVESILGALVQGVVVFVVAWIIAVPLTTVTGLPGLANAIRGSVVLGGVDDIMPPGAEKLPNGVKKLLDDSGFPNVMGPFSQTPLVDTGPPDPALQSSPVVQRVRPSVLKIHARAQSCSRALEGTGFVISPERVMTNAHVVAGTDQVSVETEGGQLDARVVLYDPSVDVAILSVPDLRARPLPFAPQDANKGDSTIVLGYPLDGPYTASAARVRERINLRGPDIYDANTVTRDVFTVRAKVQSGNSGGPLVDPNGQVVGVVFGAAVDDDETGFVLTAKEVSDEVQQAPRLSRRVDTGACAA